MATLRSLKAAHPELRQVIMLSGREHATTIVEALSLGAVNYVVKPDDPDGLGEIALETAIKQAIEKRQLVSEVAELRRQVNDDQALAFWANSTAMKSIATIVDRVADNDVTVLIRGESGVGKELVARAIHDRSVRRGRPFVKVNCAALPDDLLESELFGHEKGAFTGAVTARIGKFEYADTGTLMLDEIGEMKAGLQGKLLHVLQDGEYSRLGSNKRVSADVRIVAATNRDLESMLTRSEFREDLYYRLKVIEIFVPPLRERSDEIPQLIEFFTVKYAKRYNRREPALTPTLLDALQNYGWPGNVRELENVIKRFVILQDEALLLRELQQSAGRRSQATITQAAAVERPVAAPAVAAPAPALPIDEADDEDEGADEEPIAVQTGTSGHGLPADGPQVARGSGAPGHAESRTRADYPDAAPGALEPPQGGAASRNQLQDAAQQDQGARYRSGLRKHLPSVGNVFLISGWIPMPFTSFSWTQSCSVRPRQTIVGVSDTTACY